MSEAEKRLKDFAEISLSLSAEKDRTRLLEKIISAAMDLTHSDGGTIYERLDDDTLRVAVIINRSLQIRHVNDIDSSSSFACIPLFKENGEKNSQHLAAVTVNEKQLINISDRASETRFDFSGVDNFDQKMAYTTKSILCVPLCDHKGEVLGAMQLINATQPDSERTVAFDEETQLAAESFASLAAVAINNRRLVAELEELFESFMVVIAQTIDEKSPHTGAHCRRVPELSISLVEALHDNDQGPLASFSLTENDRLEMKIAAWLHDCGKIATPEHIVDKATKLQTIHDRISEVNLRFECVRKQMRIEALERQLEAQSNGEPLPQPDESYTSALQQLQTDQAFINRHNTGGEYMSPDDQQRVYEIAKRYSISDANGVQTPILNEDEILNLTISKGTLTDAERQVINNHIVSTINMLNSLKLPRNLKNIPEIAGGHHERMDGKGYPKGLTREQLSVQARAIGIADIFEALTSSDRPYKKANTLSQSLRIMADMARTGHIDPDIFAVFLRKGVFADYAERFLLSEQIDPVDTEALLQPA